MGDLLQLNRKKKPVTGDTVQITRKKSAEHLQGGGCSVVGKVTRVDPWHKVGQQTRPVFVEFDDRAGEWAFAYWEIALVVP